MLLSSLDQACARRTSPGSPSPDTSSPDSSSPAALVGATSALAEATNAVHLGWEAADELFAALDDALSALAERAGLASFDVDLIALLVAADIDPAFLAALNLLHPGGQPQDRPRVAAALELLGVPTASPLVRRALGAGGRLHHTGLVAVRGSGVLLTRHLELPDRVVAHLLGDPHPDPALDPYLIRVRPLPLPGADRVAAAWASGESPLWVTGADPTVGAALAVEAAGRLGLPALAIDLGRAHAEDRPEVLAAAMLEAVLRGGVLILVGALSADGDQAATALHPPLLVARLRDVGVPVALLGTVSWDPAWASWLPVVVDAGLLTSRERAALWHAVAHGTDPAVGAPCWQDLLALRVGPEEMEAVVDLARAEARLDLRPAAEPGTGLGADLGTDLAIGPAADPAVTAADLLRVARRLADRTGTTRRAEATLDDLVVPDRTRASLEEFISWARHRDDVLAQGPLTGRGKGRGIAALFAGGPGTGKTLAAQAVAGSLGLDLYQVDLTSVVDKYVGESEKRLAGVFATAERLNCVLFFDEADSLFGARSAVQDAKDRYANLEVSYLLQRMEQFDGIVVLATNLHGNLDPAFARRLHFVLHFPDPDAAARADLWRVHLRHLAELDPGDPVDPGRLADTCELAGGAIRNVVLAAAFAAWQDNGGAVGMRHLLAGIDREQRKLGRRAAASVADHPYAGAPWAGRE